MDNDGRSRDERGLLPCEWCGGPIEQPPTGRRRLYCCRTHRELAYRERKTVRRINEAVDQAAPVSSVVETPAPPVPSVDETRVPAPRPNRQRAGMTASAMPLTSYDE